MLASTVQFSKNGKSPHNPHRQPRTPQQDTGRYDEHETLHEANNPTPTSGPARSLRTQQRAYHHHPTPIPFPATPERAAVLGTRHEPAAELVSVPPSSSTPDTRGPHHCGDLPGLGVALDHHTQCGGQCSLERR